MTWYSSVAMRKSYCDGTMLKAAPAKGCDAETKRAASRVSAESSACSACQRAWWRMAVSGDCARSYVSESESSERRGTVNCASCGSSSDMGSSAGWKR